MSVSPQLPASRLPLCRDPWTFAEDRHVELTLQRAHVVDRPIEELASDRAGRAEQETRHERERHDLERLRLDRFVRQARRIEHAEPLAGLLAGDVFGPLRLLEARV